VSDDLFRKDSLWNAVQSDPSNNLWVNKLPTRSLRSVETMPTQLIYHSSSNCLTKSNLYAIFLLEKQLMNTSSYANQLCLLQSNGLCRPPRSILRFFDGTYSGYNILDGGGFNIFRPDPSFDRISDIIATAFDANGQSDSTNLIAVGQPDLRSILNYVIGKGRPD
jgi:hypothetical protein